MAAALTALYVARVEAMSLTTLTVDHGLRPESADEAEAVAEALCNLGVSEARILHVSATGEGGPEGAAREARYRALARACEEYRRPFLVLGHTLEDQAETVLLGLGRGSGARSLRGMSPVGVMPTAAHIPTLRPLLGLRREALREALRSENVKWVEDPTNYLTSSWRQASGAPLRRSAVRYLALPALEEALGSGVTQALARTASFLQDDEEALSLYATRLLEEARHTETSLPPHTPSREKDSSYPHESFQFLAVDLRPLRQAPRAVRTRALRLACLECGARPGELTSWHISHLDDLAMGGVGGRRIDLPGLRASVRNSILVFEPGSGARATSPEQERTTL